MELAAAIPAAVRGVSGLSNGAAAGAGSTSFHRYSALQSMKMPQLPTGRNPFSLKIDTSFKHCVTTEERT